MVSKNTIRSIPEIIYIAKVQWDKNDEIGVFHIVHICYVCV